VGDPFRRLIGDAGEDHSAGAIPDQDDTGQILVLQKIGDILDMNSEANFGASKMRAFPKPSKRGGKDIVTARAQQGSYFLPAPSAKPSWMNQHKSRFVFGQT